MNAKAENEDNFIRCTGQRGNNQKSGVAVVWNFCFVFRLKIIISRSADNNTQGRSRYRDSL